MASPNQIAGKATVRVNGQQLGVKQNTVEITPGYGEREMQLGEDGPEGWTEKAAGWMFKLTPFAKSGVTASQLWNIKDATVLVEFDNGLTYNLIQATVLKVNPIKSGEGTWEAEGFAMRGNEATS